MRVNRELVFSSAAGAVWALLTLVLLVVAPAGAAPSESPLLPPQDTRFGADQRAHLAHEALLFHPADDDRLADGVYTLPLPLPWPISAAERRHWELDVPGGVPLFLVTALTPAGRDFAPGASVVVDGAPVPDVERYAVPGVRLSDGATQQEYGALAVVLAPPAPGRHVVMVGCNGCAPREGPWLGTLNGASRVYVLNVAAPAPAPAAPKGGAGLAPAAPAPAQAAPAQAPAPEVSVAPALPLPMGLLGSPLELMEDVADDVAQMAQAVAPATPTPSVVLDRSFYSEALGQEMSYRIYLPAGYGPETEGPLDFLLRRGQAGRRYPVLFLLHGLGASNQQWSRLGVFEELERQIAAGGAPVIAVLPTGNTGYWVNHIAAGPRFGDYVGLDLVAHVDATYRTVARPEARAIGGISMGGNGALQIALNYPGVFGTVGAHSPALRSRQQAPYFMGGPFPGAAGAPAAGAPGAGQEAYAARDPLSLVRGNAPVAPDRLWLDIGHQDTWAARVQELHGALQERGWSHEWQPAPGGHDGSYWQRRLPEYVRYYLGALGAAAATS